MSGFLWHACHVNPGVDKKQAGSSSFISIQLSQKFSNSSAGNNVSLWTYQSWYSPKFLS